MTPEEGSMPTLIDPTANVIDVTTDVAPTAGVDVPDAPAPEEEPEHERELVFQLRDLEVQYSGHTAVRDVQLDIAANEITAFIGPSGCGKTTVLRCLNRMHDLTPGAQVFGDVTYHGESLYASKVDAAEVRRRIGMVFQKPNPFPKTIFDNVAYGPKLNGRKRSEMSDIVEHALTRAALWDEVKDKLKQSGMGLSGGQQQRLCIARTVAQRPEVILFDEPTSALDPISTGRIEELIEQLRNEFTIAIVTHNMQQAARISQFTAFMYLGELVEFGPTNRIFMNPEKRQTQDYITGRFG
jgi:phosphate transport system ATP-binding protein